LTTLVKPLATLRLPRRTRVASGFTNRKTPSIELDIIQNHSINLLGDGLPVVETTGYEAHQTRFAGFLPAAGGFHPLAWAGGNIWVGKRYSFT